MRTVHIAPVAQVRLARVIPSMHVHLCVALWLFSLHLSPSSTSFHRSPSSPSRCSPQCSTRSLGPTPCAISAWGPWPLLTTRHPSQDVSLRCSSRHVKTMPTSRRNSSLRKLDDETRWRMVKLHHNALSADVFPSRIKQTIRLSRLKALSTADSTFVMMSDVVLSSRTDTSLQSVMKCDVCIRKELRAECRTVRWHGHFFPERHEL